MSDPRKNNSLPNIISSLVKNGYHSSFHYGGNTQFAGLQSYLMNAGMQNIYSKLDFSQKEIPYSKWGAHDEIVYKKAFIDIQAMQEPFFSVIYTLSSHEPFDMPTPIKDFNLAKKEDNKFLNSIFYADSCLGSFYKTLKNSDKWKNTLVIITADHGVLQLGLNDDHVPERFHIPLIFTGGALDSIGIQNNQIGSQVDISKTILNQLNIASDDFVYSKDLLVNNPHPYALYVFTNGFGYISNDVVFHHNYKSNKVGYFMGDADIELEKSGKAYMQALYNDYLKR
jgi:phosphoglycerol transferase MdoB-like AlkP superfamily enzyme